MPGAIFLAGRGVVRLGAYPNWGYATEGVEPWMPGLERAVKSHWYVKRSGRPLAPRGGRVGRAGLAG